MTYPVDSEESDILSNALEDFKRCVDYFSDDYIDGRNDGEFVLGINQWEPDQESARRRDGLPSLVLNQMLPFVNQVVNDIRQARPSIRVTPSDSDADGDTADIYAGIIRNIERTSNANDAYDMAALNAVSKSLGWIKVRVDYAHEMTFDQDIYIDRVVNFESAYIDPNAQALDGSDAEYCFIFEDITHEEFKKMYPDASLKGFDSSSDWYSEDMVRVAEYYCKKYTKEKIYLVSYVEQMRDSIGNVVQSRTFEGTITKAEMEALEEEGVEVEVLQERETDICKIKQYTITGVEVLSQTEWMGKYIPLVPVYGLECFVEGRRRFQSLIRQAKDAQRMYNYWKSSNTAMIALQPKAPYIGPIGAFKSNPEKWAQANRQNYAFLEYDVTYDENGNPLPPPQRQAPAQGSPAMFQEAMAAKEDIRLALGMNRANMGEEDNAISGVAIRNRQIEGDNATFHFMANLSSAIAHVGCILVDLIPKVYNKPQMMRIIGEDGEPDMVPVNSPFVQSEDGALEQTVNNDYDGMYDLSKGQYDVVCDVGPSYSSKRQEMADKMLELMRIRPESAGIMGDLFIKSLDMPMGNEIAERIKATMDPAILGDDPEAAKLQAAAQQISQLQEQLMTLDSALQSKKQNTQFEQGVEMEKLKMERDRLDMEIAKSQADIEKMRSEALENTAQAQRERTEAALNVQELSSQVDDISEAIGIMLDNVERKKETVEPAKETTSIDVTIEENENE